MRHLRKMFWLWIHARLHGMWTWVYENKIYMPTTRVPDPQRTEHLKSQLWHLCDPTVYLRADGSYHTDREEYEREIRRQDPALEFCTCTLHRTESANPMVAYELHKVANPNCPYHFPPAGSQPQPDQPGA
jgi:hypothetical protein